MCSIVDFRFMIMEVYDEELVESMKYYHSGAHMPFNFLLTYITEAWGGKEIAREVKKWMDKMPEGKWPNFVVGSVLII